MYIQDKVEYSDEIFERMEKVPICTSAVLRMIWYLE